MPNPFDLSSSPGSFLPEPERSAPDRSPFALRNIRLFIWFRVLFGTRLYYPVFTILFLDYGLSLEQFAVLNAVWAWTIVLAEVPSGALADLLGRRRLLVCTALLMILEMALLAFAPLGDAGLVFRIFLVGRIVGGLAEAMGSGADEALAYDTLARRGWAGCWPRVLEVQMRIRGVGYIVGMILGAAVYDPGLINRVLSLLSIPVTVTQQMSMRYPLYLNLVAAVLVLGVTLAMREPASGPAPHSSTPGFRALLHQTLRAGAWVWRTPMALAVIVFAMVFDHTLRMLATLTSQYYRLIGIPEAGFGLLGSLVALIGLLVPRLARRMAERFSPGVNAALLAVAMLIVLSLLPLFMPFFGIAPMMAVFFGMMLTSFFASFYLNRITDSAQRATVLSFKGLACNAAYGWIGMLFAALTHHQRLHQTKLLPGADPGLIEDQAFMASMAWFPWYLALMLALAVLFCAVRRRRRTNG
ncbi:MAG: MFS transporter [Desulfobulbus sp.]|jgi:MFS family permease